MKKTLAFILLTVFLVSILASCSSDSTVLTIDSTPTETENITAPVSTEPVISDKLQQAIDNKTFEGKTINFVMSGDTLSTRSIAVDRNAEDYDPDYSMNVIVDKRNMLVERDLGVTINLVETVMADKLINYVQHHLHAPEKEIDIIGGHQWFDLGLAYGYNSGSLISFEQLNKEGKNYLNPSAVYWDSAAYRNASFEDEHYWITGDLSQKWLSSLYVSIVNETIWDEYSKQIKEKTGYDNVYDLTAEGGWTLDFITWLNEKGAKTLLHSQDQLFNTTADVLYSSAGFRLTQYNQIDDATAEINLINSEFKEFAEKITELYDNFEIFEISDDEKNILTAFKKGGHLVTFATVNIRNRNTNTLNSQSYLILKINTVCSADEAYTRYFTYD